MHNDKDTALKDSMEEFESSSAEVEGCGGCMIDFGSYFFSALSLGWFFYSYILEFSADLALSSQLKVLDCLSKDFNWVSVAVALGKNISYHVQPADLIPFKVGNGYDVNGSIFVPDIAVHCHLETDINFLNFFIFIAFINVVLFAIISTCLTCYKFSMFSNCRIDKHEERAGERIDKALGVQQLSSVIFSITKILVYASILNKLRYYGLWNDGLQDFKLSDFDAPILFGYPVYRNVADLVKGDLVKTSFNIFRTYWFFQAIYFATGEGCDMLKNTIRCLFVMLPATLLWTAKAVGDIGIFHYVQRVYTDQGIFTVPTMLSLVIVNVISGSMALLLVFCYNVIIIFLGVHRMKEHKKRNKCLSVTLFTFPLFFVLLCFICPVAAWLNYSDKRLSIFVVLFYLVMACNGVLAVIILVGLFCPMWYQTIVFFALGREKAGRHRSKKKNQKDHHQQQQ